MVTFYPILFSLTLSCGNFPIVTVSLGTPGALSEVEKQMACRSRQSGEDSTELDEMAKLGLSAIHCGDSVQSVSEERLCLQPMTGLVSSLLTEKSRNKSGNIPSPWAPANS